MVKGEALLFDTNSNVNKIKDYWKLIIEREGLAGVLDRAPELTLESFKKVTLDIKKSEVCVVGKSGNSRTCFQFSFLIPAVFNNQKILVNHSAHKSRPSHLQRHHS